MKIKRTPPGTNGSRSGRVSRRRFLELGGASVAGAALLGAGCGGTPEGGKKAAPGGVRVVQSAYGETRVPEDPDRVVTLDPTVLLDATSTSTCSRRKEPDA